MIILCHIYLGIRDLCNWCLLPPSDELHAPSLLKYLMGSNRGPSCISFLTISRTEWRNRKLALMQDIFTGMVLPWQAVKQPECKVSPNLSSLPKIHMGGAKCILCAKCDPPWYNFPFCFFLGCRSPLIDYGSLLVASGLTIIHEIFVLSDISHRTLCNSADHSLITSVAFLLAITSS